MIKKFFKTSLIVTFFALFVILPNLSLAANPPSGLTPCSGTQPLAVLLNWSDETVHHYELYYKRADETNWTDRYPSISQYQVTGLSPSQNYEWYVISCGNAECSDKAQSGICSFTTEELAPPPGDGNGGDTGPVDLVNPLQAETLQEAIDAFINFLFYLAMAVAPILIVYAGFLILTAGGDATKITKAKQIILWTLIAVAIILFAKGFPALIKGALGG